MPDMMDVLAQNSKQIIAEGYYQQESAGKFEAKEFSFKENILKCQRNPVIAEVKVASPSRNVIRENVDVIHVAAAMVRGGAVGLSVLTEPNHFKGSLNNLRLIRESVNVPLLMKDFVISTDQIDAASRFGADAVLLIQALFDREYCDQDQNKMIQHAHSLGLEVLLEAHGEDEFKRVVESNADMIGINNRDLRTFTVSLNNTARILKSCNTRDRIVVSESGVDSPRDLLFLKDAGARAFLVGTSIMSSHNVEEKVRELAEA